MTDLLCIGLTTLEIIGSPIANIQPLESTSLIEQIEIIPAGTAGGTAMVAAKLGLSVALASAVGWDRKGKILRAALEEIDIDCSTLRTLDEAATSANSLTVDYNGQGPNFHAIGASKLMVLDDEMQAAAERARFVHYGGVGALFLDNGPGAQLLASAKKAGAVTTCDLIMASGQIPSELQLILPYVDWFMPGATEALAVTGENRIEDAAATFLEWGAKNCIIKDGANGFLLLTRNGSPKHFPAFYIEPFNTTSCGDSFCAGFICALANGTTSIDDAITIASATSALVALGFGALGKVES